MKITKIDVMRVKTRRPTWNPVFCRIYTDTGIYGDGEGAMAYGTGSTGLFATLKDFSNLIIGMDPMKNEVIWNKLYKQTFWAQNGEPLTFSAMSALDIALWDIKGKAYGVPIHELLGGKQRDDVRVYASQLQFGWEWDLDITMNKKSSKPEEYAEAAPKVVSEGYDAIKADFFTFDRDYNVYTWEDQTRLLTPDKLNMVEERIAATREAIGNDVDIIVENHSFTDAMGAVRIARMMEKYRILYFEIMEPRFSR